MLPTPRASGREKQNHKRPEQGVCLLIICDSAIGLATGLLILPIAGWVTACGEKKDCRKAAGAYLETNSPTAATALH